MNKKEFITAVAGKTGITKKDAAIVLEAFMDTIKEAMSNDEKVHFTGFGTFEVVERAAREGRNPQTGETMIIPARKTPKFKAGKTLKEATR